MTAFIPTTLMTVYRWSATGDDPDATNDGRDPWGDPIDAGPNPADPAGENTTVATGLPAAVAEDRQRSYLATEQRGGVVEYLTVRFRPGVDVREGDRLQDEAGHLYAVEAVSNPPGLAGRADVRTTCTKVGATSTP